MWLHAFFEPGNGWMVVMCHGHLQFSQVCYLSINLFGFSRQDFSVALEPVLEL